MCIRDRSHARRGRARWSLRSGGHGTPLRVNSTPQSWRRALRTEASIVGVRWAAVVFAAFQVLTYYRPYPAGVLPVALASVAAIGIGNAVLAASVSYTHLRAHETVLDL